MKKSARYLSILILMIFTAILGYIFAEVYLTKNNNVTISNKTQIRVDPGQKKYIKYIFLTSSYCAFATDQELINAVTKDIEELNYLTSINNLNFFSTLISTDREYLENNIVWKSFDEIISGGSWYNSGLLSYFYNNGQGEVGTPEVLIMKSSYELVPSGYSIRSIARKDSLIRRLVGAEEIIKYKPENESFILTEKPE
jgi:hypothetical protein